MFLRVLSRLTLKHILHELAVLSPNGITNLESVIDSMVERLPGRGMLILVSDFLTKETDVEKKTQTSCVARIGNNHLSCFRFR